MSEVAKQRPDPDPARAERVKDLVSRAIALPRGEREGFIAHECAADVRLAFEVRDMVTAHDAAGSFMSSPTHSIVNAPGQRDAPTELSPAREGAGSRIGPYKLLELIGEGGFGSVYLAEQREPISRRVALKIIKSGMDSRMVAARFEAERQALALMDHPHIARVFDGGVTDAALGARPFFVMEYVKGDPITDFADAHKLSVAQRLALFMQVCQAVQHAHTKGVIHRDLKPSNVLVSMTDGKAFAKVIDFGIAKSLASRLTEKTLFTEHRQLIGTPEYMSPEQAEGSPDIDTRTDVYALGVLLYELLTGATPFDAARLRSAAFAEMQRIIKEEEPPTPSMRLGSPALRAGSEAGASKALAAIAAARSAEPTRLGTQIKGELDWIVMKALDKDRARRYESPNQFAADVERHLAGEAVVAAPVSVGYRVRKFVRRNRGAVGGCGAVGVALILGIAGTTFGLVLADQAKGRLKEANSTAVSALEDIALEGTRGLEALDADLPLFPEIRGEQGFVLAPALRDDQTKPGGNGFFFMKRELASGRVLPLDDAKLLPALADMSVSMVRHALSVHKTLRKQTDAVKSNAYAASIRAAAASVRDRNWVEAADSLSAAPDTFRDWEWRYLQRQADNSVGGQSLGNWEAWGLAANPSGRQVVVFGDCTDAQIVDAQSLEAVARLSGHKSAIRQAAFLNGGRNVATVSDDETLRLYDPDTGAALTSIELHMSPNALFIDSNSSFVVVTGEDWKRDGVLVTAFGDPSTGLLQTIPSTDGEGWGLKALTLAPEGSRLLLTSKENALFEWDRASASLRRLPVNISSSPTTAIYNSRFRVAAIICEDNSLRIVDLDTGASVGAPMTHEGRWIRATPAWSPDGTLLASGGEDNRVRVWDTEGHPIVVLDGHTKEVTELRFSSDGSRLASSSWDGTIRLWHMPSGEPVGEFAAGTDGLRGFAFGPAGKNLIGVSSSAKICRWSNETWLPNPRLVGAVPRRTGLYSWESAETDEARRERHALLRESRLAVGCCGVIEEVFATEADRSVVIRDGTITIADGSGATIGTLDLGASASLLKDPFRVAVSGNGTRVALTSLLAGDVTVFELDTGRRICAFKSVMASRSNACRVSDLAFSPDGSVVYVIAEDAVSCWSAINGALSVKVPLPNLGQGKLALSADGTRLVVVGTDIHVLAADTLAVERLIPRRGVADAIALSKSGRRLAAVGRDGTIEVWDLAGGKLLALTPPPTLGPLTAERAGFSSDDSMLLVSYTNSLLVYSALPQLSMPGRSSSP